MRRSAVVITCAVLVATLLSPAVAMAKGGNGRHSMATRGAFGNGNGKAGTGSSGKGSVQTPPVGTQPRQSAKPKAASPQRGTTAKVVPKPTRKAPKVEAAEKAERPQSAMHEPPARTTPSTMAVPSSPPSTGLAEARDSADTIGAASIETRGVLDTIRLNVDASLEGVRATAAAMWSSVTSWFGD